MADGSGKKSDPPVGTGRGLKPRAEKPQSEAVRKFRAALFLLRSALQAIFVVIFKPCIFFGTSHLAYRRPKGSKTNMLAAAFVGLATNQIA